MKANEFDNQGSLHYFDEKGSKLTFNYETYKNIDTKNSYKIKHVNNIAKGINLILGRFNFFYKQTGSPQEYIILSSKDLARNIGCSHSQASNVFGYLKEIFGFNYGGSKARTIKLNNKVIELLTVYTEEDLQLYMKKYSIHGENIYRVRQIYNWCVFTQSLDDQQDNKELREQRYEFMKDPFIKNYHHYCSTSNRKDSTRLSIIEAHEKFLNNVEKEQVSKIKKVIGELKYYLHKILIKLEQKISAAKRRVSRSTEEQPHSQVSNRNKTEGEQESTRRVGSKKVKEPEASPRDIILFATFWNIQSKGRKMKPIKVLTTNRIKSIRNLVKYRGKENVLYALGNLRKLIHDRDNYIEFMSFERFTKFEYFDMILNREDEHTKLKDESNYMEIKNNYYRFYNQDSLVSIDNVPKFKNMQEANTWFQSKLVLM